MVLLVFVVELLIIVLIVIAHTYLLCVALRSGSVELTGRKRVGAVQGVLRTLRKAMRCLQNFHAGHAAQAGVVEMER